MSTFLWMAAVGSVGFAGGLGVMAVAERVVESRERKRLCANETFAEVAGHRVRYRYVAGPEGSPLVVLLSGFPAALEEYTRMQQALRPYASSLSYDRCGSGFSEPRFKLCDGEVQVEELSGLLRALELHAPVVLVGFSNGAILARTYAARAAEKVAALVLLDPTLPELSLASTPRINRLKFDVLIAGLLTKRFFGFTRMYRTLKAPRPRAQLGEDANNFEFSVCSGHWWAALVQALVAERTERQALQSVLSKELPIRLLTTSKEGDEGHAELLAFRRDVVETARDGEVEMVPHANHLDFMYNAEIIELVVRTISRLVARAKGSLAALPQSATRGA